MRYVKPPVCTVCVGSAYGEAAMLLAAGEKVPCPLPARPLVCAPALLLCSCHPSLPGT